MHTLYVHHRWRTHFLFEKIQTLDVRVARVIPLDQEVISVLFQLLFLIFLHELILLVSLTLMVQDIRRSISGNMRSLMKDVPASSVYSLRSKSTKVGISDTSRSLITNSDASSEHSLSINSHGLDGSEVEDIDLGSEQGHSSSNSQHE